MAAIATATATAPDDDDIAYFHAIYYAYQAALGQPAVTDQQRRVRDELLLRIVEFADIFRATAAADGASAAAVCLRKAERILSEAPSEGQKMTPA